MATPPFRRPLRENCFPRGSVRDPVHQYHHHSPPTCLEVLENGHKSKNILIQQAKGPRFATMSNQQKRRKLLESEATASQNRSRIVKELQENREIYKTCQSICQMAPKITSVTSGAHFY